MKFGKNVLHPNTHRLTESDFATDVIIIKMAIMTSLHTSEQTRSVTGAASGGRKGQTAPSGSQEEAAKMGLIRGHQASQDFWGGKTVVRPGHRCHCEAFLHARLCSSARQFLIYSTFELVL